MGKTVRKILVLVLVLLCLGTMAVLTGCSKTAAVVNGERITYKQLDQQLEKRFGQQFLDVMILEKLVEQKAKKEKIAVTPQEIQAKIDEIKLRQPNFDLMLKMQNMTIKDVEEQIKMGLLLNKIVSKDITENQLKDFYDKNKEKIEQIKAAHILVKTKPEADAVLASLKAGEDFSKLAKEKSIDPGSKDKGGELGYFSAMEMDPNFTKVAFNMQVGEISEPVKSNFGWHIIKVEDKKVTFDQLKDRIMLAIITPDQEQKCIQKLKDEAKIKNYLKPEPPAEKTGKK